MIDRQRQFDASRPATDDSQTRRRTVVGGELLPYRQETADGLDGRDEVGCETLPGNPARVDRQHVVAQRGAIGKEDPPFLRVDARRLRGDEPGIGEPGELRQIDVDFVPTVGSGHVAGEHPRIRRVRFPGHDREPHTGFETHAEAFQHLDVGVSAAEQHDVAKRRCVIGLHRPLKRQPPAYFMG